MKEQEKNSDSELTRRDKIFWRSISLSVVSLISAPLAGEFISQQLTVPAFMISGVLFIIAGISFDGKKDEFYF